MVVAQGGRRPAPRSFYKLVDFLRRGLIPSFASCPVFFPLATCVFLPPESSQRAVKPILMGKDCIAQAQSGERQHAHTLGSA